jgi:hypothetical protein
LALRISGFYGAKSKAKSAMRFQTFFFIACYLTLISGCSGEDQYAVSAKVGSVNWYSNSYAQAALGTSRLIINARSKDYPEIALSILNYDMPGTFPIDSSSNAFLYGNNLASGYYMRSSQPGTITITAFDAQARRIQGTFSGTAFSSAGDSVLVTDGKFDVNYQ